MKKLLFIINPMAGRQQAQTDLYKMVKIFADHDYEVTVYPTRARLDCTRKVLEDADFSQLELRLLAHISGDPAMQAAFTSGQDIHSATAAQVFHVAPEDVTHEMRRRAKAVNFGIVYGISAFSLSQDIGVSVAEPKAYKDAYIATFPALRR